LPELLTIVALAFFIGSCADGRRGVNPGEKAPNVEGITVDGVATSLDAVQGKVILVNFWATWCAPCVAELPALQALHTALKGQGFQVVGIAVDDAPENVREAQQRFGITYPIIIDTKASSKRGYGIRGMPESFVLDKERRVVVIADPADGSPVTKIIGPREWTEKRSLQEFQALLQ